MMIDEKLLDEAVRMGGVAAEQTAKQLRCNQRLINGIDQALRLMNSGRANDAKAELVRALTAAERILR
jgi:hypothetical protein